MAKTQPEQKVYIVATILKRVNARTKLASGTYGRRDEASQRSFPPLFDASRLATRRTRVQFTATPFSFLGANSNMVTVGRVMGRHIQSSTIHVHASHTALRNGL
jgi:hypothetical protein